MLHHTKIIAVGYIQKLFESLGSIADLKLGLNEQYFIGQYIDATQTYKSQ